MIEAIADGEITDHRISFDVVLSRFLAKMQWLGFEVTADQASMAFYHLIGDLVWNIAYRDIERRIDSVSPGAIRDRVSHAVLKEPFRWLLRKHANRQRVLNAIANAWWKEGRPPMPEPRYWWVNQGQTYLQEKAAGIIWAPQQDKAGKANFHWENVGKVRKDDLIFHYANGAIVAVSQCSESGKVAPKPPSLGENWQQDGWLANTTYSILGQPVPLQKVARQIRKLDLKYGPINKSDGVNQGYLYSLPPAATRAIAEQLELAELPEELAAILRRLLADQWDAFIYWAKRFWSEPHIRESERPYKLEIGAQLDRSNLALKDGTDWFTPLRRAFQGKNNLTNYRAHDKFLTWCKSNPDDARAFFKAVWK